jgi:nitrous oxide reductase accessory protein NosL
MDERLAAAGWRRSIAPVALLLGMLLAAGCFRGREEERPVTVHWDRDRDEYCGMLVSDRRFAAQAVEPGGRGHVFDDAGCLVRWLAQQPSGASFRLWVRDRHADRWIDPERARWRSGEQTPSGYGFGASLEPGYGTLTFAEVRRTILEQGPARPSVPLPFVPTPSRP